MNVLCKIGILLGFSVIITGCPTALTIRNVSAPAINCKFDQDCKITVSDTTEHFTVGPTSGDAFLQSRTFPRGETETTAEGQYAYLYRIDLRNLAGVTALPCVNTFTIDFGPVAQLDYDDDGTPEHIFVVTSGGLGSVAPSSASQDGRIITFNFAPGVCAGSAPGNGQSSFFFGLTSNKPARQVTSQIRDSLGGTTSLDARAPQP